MAIDFTLSPELEELRLRVRDFIQGTVVLGESRIGDREDVDRGKYLQVLFEMRNQAQEAGLWLPHMPVEWGGMGLGHQKVSVRRPPSWPASPSWPEEAQGPASS